MPEFKLKLPVIENPDEHDLWVDQVISQEEKKDCLDKFKSCGIGKEYFNFSLESFEREMPKQKEMIDKARIYFGHIIHNEKSNMLITGNAGEGKTHLAVGLLRQFCFQKHKIKVNGYEFESFYSVHYLTSKDLCDDYRKTQAFNTQYSTYSFYRDYTKTYDIMVIDELGKSTDKAEWNILFDVLDKRMQEGKSTIIISNLDYETLNSSLGDYGMSRLNISGNLVRIDSTGLPDYRQRANKFKEVV